MNEHDTVDGTRSFYNEAQNPDNKYRGENQ